MEDDNEQSVLFLRHLRGLQTGVLSTPTNSFLRNPDSPRPSEISSNDIHSTGIDPTKGDHIFSPQRGRTGVLFARIPSKETFRKVQVDSEPEDNKQINQVLEVQNGHNFFQ